MGICRQRGQSAWSTARRRNDYVEFTVMQHLVEEPTGIERGKCDQGCAALTYERKYSAYSILAWQRIGKLGIKSAAAAAAAARHRVAALGIAFISSLPCQQCQTNRTGASRSFGGHCASLLFPNILPWRFRRKRRDDSCENCIHLYTFPCFTLALRVVVVVFFFSSR